MSSNESHSTVDGRSRAVITGIQPQVDAGRYPVKRSIGETVTVEADVFTDGHDLVSALLLFRRQGDEEWTEVEMAPLVNDRWRAQFVVNELGTFEYSIVAWVDSFKTWLRDLKKRIDAGQDTEIDYKIGSAIVFAAAAAAKKPENQLLESYAESLASTSLASCRVLAADVSFATLVNRYPDRSLQLSSDVFRVTVDPVRARFSSWYEFFPRSTSPHPGKHGTFRDCESWLPYVAEMGFDVVYLPPIHPIGRTFRKGKNNAVTAEPGDVGSPWAIGAAEGGHTAVHPDLGTIDDFRQFVRAAAALNLDIALDVAFQVSPDHPYVTQHVEWFRSRPDGTIQYAENPPKKYQDIYPFDFESERWSSMWDELRDVFLFWLDEGISIFRVDNPHTKAFPFWEWVIAEVKKRHPQAMFLSEAFTRPKVMYQLAKVGFTQSYTYFPWRHTRDELTSYLTELTQTHVREYFRPNHWPNTPDILTEFLQTSGRAGFMQRLVLAATLGANYGIYGPAFELCESTPRHHGSEEYLDSEKYQLRHWNRDDPASLRTFIALVNRIRRENPALQNDWSLRFHDIGNDALIAYSKQSPDGSNVILTVVNLDPRYKHGGMLNLPVAEYKLEETRSFQAHDLLTGARFLWGGSRNYVELDPQVVPAHIFAIRRRLRTEQEFEYFL